MPFKGKGLKLAAFKPWDHKGQIARPHLGVVAGRLVAAQTAFGRARFVCI